jgi:hypothetical protein
MGADCTHRAKMQAMPKIIQIRDVPDDVRDALADAAREEGMSLTSYVRRELEHVAGRRRRTRENAALVRKTQQRVAGGVDRETILSALHEGRGA